ncbi:MAG: MarR family transcriptional regulator [Microbacteriaceae bacterium]|nr:MAG: MarR family transcriptional regulator [Microbacteriaceae bacterium]
MHDPRVVDARGRMLDVSGMDEAHIAHTVLVLNALRDWRAAEERLSEASRSYMKLGDNDMRALRYIVVVTDRGDVATARGIAEHLGISSAATTKLLDRLERGDHIRRLPHPHDRRSSSIVITPETRAAAESTVGREHARRFRVAAALSPEERDVVIRFLGELSRTTEGDWADAVAHPAG